MTWIEGQDSVFVWLLAALIIHIVLAGFETASMRWVPSLSRSKFILWVLFVWLVPIIGIAVARGSLRLARTKGDGHPDTSRDHIQVFDD